MSARGEATLAPAAPGLAARLASVAGERVRAEASECAAFAIGDAVPALVCTPADEAEAAACVAAVAGAGGALIPLGLGAHRMLGHAPARYDVALSCARLARIREYTPADMTVTVEAGTTIAALQELLAAEGQWLPLDPPLPARTTVGGLIAADLGGALRASQGRVRDFVIGVRAVTAEGRAVRAGGKVVKNVAGYDLMKLIVGSLGTLAVVTEATFKLRPRPALRRTLVIEAGTLPRACALGDALATRALDLLAATLVIELDGGVTRARLVAELGGVTEDVATAEGRLRALAAETGAAEVTTLTAKDPWARMLAEDVRDFVRNAVGDVIARLTVLPRRTSALLTAVVEIAGPTAARVHADPRSGRVTIAAATADAVGMIDALAAAALAHGGSMVMERLPASATEIRVWQPLPAALPLMRAMKAALDPHGMLAPGRFVARI